MNTKGEKWISLIIVLFAPLLSVIDVFIVNVAIPAIQKGISGTDGEIQLVIAGYLLGYASFLITGGRAGDHLGRKKVFFWAVFSFTLTSCLCGLATNGWQLNIARFLQGVSASFMVPQTISYIQVLFPEHRERAKAFGIYGITLGTASVIGQFLGGYLSQSHFAIEGWRLIFFINLPLGMIAMLATALYLKETPARPAQQFDYSGAILLTLGLACLIVPIIEGRELGFPVWCIGLLLCSFVILYAFFKEQKRKLIHQEEPLINSRLFQFKDFNIGLLAVLFFFMVHNSYLMMSTVYLQNGLGYPAYQAGLFFVLFGIGFTVSSILAIRYVVQLGKLVLQSGVVIMLLMLLLQMYLFRQGASPVLIYGVLAMQGFGTGMVMPSLLTMALKSIPVSFSGAASGVYTTFQQAASALGVSIIGGIFFFILDTNTKHYLKAFRYGLSADIICLLLVSLMLYLLPHKTSETVVVIGSE